MRASSASNRGRPGSVLVTDVTLREFGQNVPHSHINHFNPEARIGLARDLMKAGVTSMEVFSCVSPRAAPAMARELLTAVARGLGRTHGVDIITLVPNLPGYRTFLDLGLGPDGLDHILGAFLSAVEAHNLANLGRTIPETLKEYGKLVGDAVSRGVRVNGYISGAFGYRTAPGREVLKPTAKQVSEYMDRLLQMGARTVILSDLQGVADSLETRDFLEKVLEERNGRDVERMGYHPHHVSGDRAVENSLAAWDLGIRRFDASLGGTGGCVTGAPGNQPTEGLVRAFHERGVWTGVDEAALVALALRVEREIYRKIPLTRRGT